MPSSSTPLVLDWNHAWSFVRSGHGHAEHAAGSCLRTGESGAHGDVSRYVERLRREAPTLPFLSLPFAEDLARQLDTFAEFFHSFRHMLVLGIGGSALGARALQKAFFARQDRPGHDGPWLWIADNIDPAGFRALLDRLPPEDTLVVVISKSGGTIETVAQYLLILPWLQKHLPGTWQEHLFMVTDAAKGFLRDETDRYFLRSLPVPENLGGRFSVLSAVGLVPAVFMGLNWKELLRGAADVGRPLAASPELLPGHPAWKLGVWGSHLFFAGYTQLVFFCYAPAWASFGPWFAQLWAESLGKQGKGSMPVPAVGVTDQHSLLQMFLDGPRDKGCLFVTAPAGGSGEARSAEHVAEAGSAGRPEASLEPAASTLAPAGDILPADLPAPWQWLSGVRLSDVLEAETLATRMSLCQKGIPLVGVTASDTGEYAAGRMIMLLEAGTVFTGWLLDIDPLDQPAVEEGKRLARARLGAPGSEADALRLRRFLEGASGLEDGKV